MTHEDSNIPNMIYLYYINIILFNVKNNNILGMINNSFDVFRRIRCSNTAAVPRARRFKIPVTPPLPPRPAAKNGRYLSRDRLENIITIIIII